MSTDQTKDGKDKLTDDITHLHVYTDSVILSKNKKKPTSKKETAIAPSVTVGSKALPVIAQEEVRRIVDYGLGRGLDATNRSPWLHKSSFQVRKVTPENLIGTEEGGSLHSYEREVSSITKQQTDLKASVVVPQAPVNLGLEGEQFRSVTTVRQAIGRRVVNRTISFATHFDHPPQCGSKSEEHIPNFEERLSKWILERIIHRYELAKKIDGTEIPPEVKQIKGVNPCEEFSNYLDAVDQEQAKQIVVDCMDFIQHFHITHYVCSISLGAVEYRILSKTEYYNQLSAKGTVGFETIANVVLSESFSKKSSTKSFDLRQIGRIVNKEVARGTYDEAVIGIGIQPIHQLVRLRFLHLALRLALLDYFEVQGDRSAGPFLIVSGDNDIFLKVHKENGYALEGTTQASEASSFYIIPTDDGDHPYEFMIAWQNKEDKPIDPQIQHQSLDISSHHTHGAMLMKYLDAHVNILGRNSGPLFMKNGMVEENARFSLCSRLYRRKANPVDIREWVSGKDRFFINCTRRSYRIDGFLAMKRALRGGGMDQSEFTSVCVSSVKHHDDIDTFMLFSLVFPGKQSEVLSAERKVSDQFHNYIKEKHTASAAAEIDERFNTSPQNLLKDMPESGSQRASSGMEMIEIVPKQS